MKFPKLKHTTLCQVLPYIILLGAIIIPSAIFVSIKAISDAIKLVFVIVLSVCVITFMFRSSVTLFTMDMILAMYQCYKSARKQFPLDKSFSVEKVEKKLSRFGKASDSVALYLKPQTLRYKSSVAMTVVAKSIEKVVATYHVDYLDSNIYGEILKSATTNSRALEGKKKPLILDKEQKTSPINRATVAIIYAKKIDERLKAELFDKVCKNNGDDFDSVFLPCVIDLESRTCVFDSLRTPNIGIMIPAKNRCISLIRKFILNRKLNLKSNDLFLEPTIEDLDPEQSLWSFWRDTHRETVLDERDTKKRFKTMAHREVIFQDDFLYVKWEERGIISTVELIEESKVAKIDAIKFYNYPKVSNIAKNTIERIEKIIYLHFAQLGYTVEFVSSDD